MTRRTVAASAVYLLKNCGGSRKPQTGASIFLRDQRGQPATFSKRTDKFSRICTFAIERAPIGPWEARTNLAHFFADRSVRVSIIRFIGARQHFSHSYKVAAGVAGMKS